MRYEDSPCIRYVKQPMLICQNRKKEEEDYGKSYILHLRIWIYLQGGKVFIPRSLFVVSPYRKDIRQYVMQKCKSHHSVE